MNATASRFAGRDDEILAPERGPRLQRQNQLRHDPVRPYGVRAPAPGTNNCA